MKLLLWVLVRFGMSLVRDQGKFKWCRVNCALLSPASPSQGTAGKLVLEDLLDAG